MTFLEIAGDVVETLPTPEPYPAVQWWFKFVPALIGNGFDYGPILIRVDQVRTHRRWSGSRASSCSATCPAARWPTCRSRDRVDACGRVRTATHEPTVVGPVDADAFLPYSYARYDGLR